MKNKTNSDYEKMLHDHYERWNKLGLKHEIMNAAFAEGDVPEHYLNKQEQEKNDLHETFKQEINAFFDTKDPLDNKDIDNEGVDISKEKFVNKDDDFEK